MTDRSDELPGFYGPSHEPPDDDPPPAVTSPVRPARPPSATSTVQPRRRLPRSFLTAFGVDVIAAAVLLWRRIRGVA